MLCISDHLIHITLLKTELLSVIYKLETQDSLNPTTSHGRTMMWTHLCLAHDLDHLLTVSWRLRNVLGKEKGGHLREQEWPMFQTTFGRLPKTSTWASHFMKMAIGPIDGFQLTPLLSLEVTERHFRLNFKIDMFCLLFCTIVILCWKEWFTCIKEWPVISLLSETNKKK